MIVQALAFYLFSFVAVAAAVMVISARNPVHSVLFLILAFFNGAGLFVLLGAEFNDRDGGKTYDCMAAVADSPPVSIPT